ncbi:cytochrome P450, partial [Mycena vulgaris]
MDFMQQFQPSEVFFHRPGEMEAAQVFLHRLLDSPAKFERHLRHRAGMGILFTAYGINVQPEDDPHVDISENAFHAMACTGNRGAYLVDSLPFLKWVPDFFLGAGFKKEARELCKSVLAVPEAPYSFAKKSLIIRSFVSGTAKPSIASQILQEIEETQDPDERRTKNYLTRFSPVAGADTTSVLGSFVLAITMYPEVQKKAQAAVDDVIGHGRLPGFDDNIPYVEAVVREVLRWLHSLPSVGVPHAVTEDDIYEGYYIPRSAIVVGNSWPIL